jgi:RNase P protein component
MFRVLTVAAAIAGTAIGLAPLASADPALGGSDDPGRYPTDVPGMNYQAVNGAPCANGQHAIFIAQADGQTVHFGLDHPLQFFAGQQALDAPDKFAHFLLRVSIVQAHHGDGMLVGLEFTNRFAAHALARRIWSHQIRELFLEVQQLMIQAVVFLVRDGGHAQDIIGVIVPANLGRQLRVTVFGFSLIHGN